MSFAAVFSDIRRRRRIPMRLFQQLASVSPSYIHDIEQGNALPSPEKLAAIASVLRTVAQQQGAADPDADTRELTREREITRYERLGLRRPTAEVLYVLNQLDDTAIHELAEPLSRAIAYFGTLGRPLQSGMGRTLSDIMRLVDALEKPAQTDFGSEIVDSIAKVIDRAKQRAETTEDISPPEVQVDRYVVQSP